MERNLEGKAMEELVHFVRWRRVEVNEDGGNVLFLTFVLELFDISWPHIMPSSSKQTPTPIPPCCPSLFLFFSLSLSLLLCPHLPSFSSSAPYDYMNLLIVGPSYSSPGNQQPSFISVITSGETEVERQLQTWCGLWSPAASRSHI